MTFKKINKVYHILLSVILTVVMICAAAPDAYADMGPKPSIELHIKNPPEGVYYVDILTDENCGDCQYSEEICRERGLNYEMVQLLKSVNIDGMTPRFGGFNGTDDTINQPAEVYSFTYSVPQRFRVVVVTDKLETIVSPVVERKTYNSVMTFDVEKCLADAESRSVKEDRLGTLLMNAAILLFTLGMTLLVERVVFALFRINMKVRYNTNLFLLMNAATQIFLYFGIFLLTNFLDTTFFINMGLLGLELVIIAAESLVFSFKMKENNREKVAVCTVTANLVSALLSAPVFLLLLFLRLI